MDPNFSTVDSRFKPRMNERLARLVLPRRHVELPAVPRAGNDAAIEPAFSQWATLMGADPVEGVELSANVE